MPNGRGRTITPPRNARAGLPGDYDQAAVLYQTAADALRGAGVAEQVRGQDGPATFGPLRSGRAQLTRRSASCTLIFTCIRDSPTAYRLS